MAANLALITILQNAPVIEQLIFNLIGRIKSNPGETDAQKVTRLTAELPADAQQYLANKAEIAAAGIEPIT
jgi:hypothetical protein